MSRILALYHLPHFLSRGVRATASLWTFGFGLAYAQSAPAPASSAVSAPVLFIVDSANTLRSFDVDGRPLQEMAVDRQRAVLNGGAVVAMGKVYLTYERLAGGTPGPAIAAFNAETLKPLMLHMGAFTSSPAADAGRYVGVTFDSASSEFYVVTERLGVLAFDRAGKYLPLTPDSKVEVAAISSDAGQTGLWGVTERRDLVRFKRTDGAPAMGIEVAFPLKQRGQKPVAVTVCPADNVEGPPAALVVLFGTLRHGVVTGEARAFDATGVSLGAAFDGKIVNPHGLVCTASGDIFIAADNGLLAYRLDGHPRTPPGGLATLGMPILGVAAAP